MSVPYDLTVIDETVLDIQIYSVDLENTFKRSFTWYVSDYNKMNCTIQIMWSKPPWISSTIVRDKLFFHVLEREKFIEPRTRRLRSTSKETVILTQTGTWEIEIPPQNYPNAATANLKAAAEVTGTAIKLYGFTQLVA